MVFETRQFNLSCTSPLYAGFEAGTLPFGISLRACTGRPPVNPYSLRCLRSKLDRSNFECSRTESNCHQSFRKALFYPLNYRSNFYIVLRLMVNGQNKVLAGRQRNIRCAKFFQNPKSGKRRNADAFVSCYFFHPVLYVLL